MSVAAANTGVFPDGAAKSAAGAAALLRLPWRRNAWRGPSGEWSGVACQPSSSADGVCALTDAKRGRQN